MLRLQVGGMFFCNTIEYLRKLGKIIGELLEF